MKSYLNIALFVAAGPLSVSAQTLPTARVDSVFAEFNRSDRPGCTLGIFRGGEIAYTNGYGMANLEYGIALQPRSVFHVASISKQFTAFAVELLVSDGRVSWDDPIQQYVPEIPEYDHSITLRHLTHHTSGVRDQWNLLSMAGWRWQADLVTQGNALEIMSRQTALNFTPGDEYVYSNSGYTLLAVVVERVSGQTLREFTDERIFGPLGMTSTHFHDDHEMIVPDRAYGYRLDTDGWAISIPDFAIVGASSLFTTVEDMAKWDRNLRDHIIGDNALYERFFERGVLNNGDTTNYAHGITRGRFRGQWAVGHGGADAGYRTNYLRFPELDIGLVSFCNFAGANPGAYVRDVASVILADHLAPASEDDDVPAPVDRDRWRDTFERISGFYRDPLNDRPLNIWNPLRGGRITPGRGRGPRMGTQLIPVDGSTFTMGPEGDTLTITMDGEHPRHLERNGRRYEYIGPPVDGIDTDEYVGTYWSDELGTEYRLVVPEDETAAIILAHRKGQRRQFRPVFRDGFVSGGDWLTFVRDASGRVTGFTWSNPRVRKVIFERR